MLVKGNEVINSLFKSGEKENDFTSEYYDTLRYLEKMEKIRKNPMDSTKIKKGILSRAVNILEKTKTKDTVKKIYRISKD